MPFITTASARLLSVIGAGCLLAALTLALGNVNAETTAVRGKPLTAFETADFSGSGICTVCHANLFDQAKNYVGMDRHWRSTMMANAARDPYWQAKVAAEVARTPALKAAIEDTCGRCHTPMARFQAVTDGGSTALLGTGFLAKYNRLNAAALDGVSCTLCHQVDAANLGKTGSFSGGYHVDTSTTPPDRPIYGPYDDQFIMNMRMASGYTPVFGAQTLSPDLCGSCHTLFTPFVDDAGNIAGTFPEQTPLLEWRNSSYAKGKSVTCQNCHMPEAVGSVRISSLPVGKLKPRPNFAQHHFVGGNVFMLELLKGNISKLGLTADEEHFDDTIARARAQLESKAAKLTIKNATRQGDDLILDLIVSPLTGHKFPTGFPARRAWIELTVRDGSGAVVFASGTPKADGTIAGNAADEDAGKYEPHYDVIDDEDEVQIYESVMQDVNGAVTYTLLRASAYLKDNRLLPAGFKTGKASPDIAVRGEAAEDKDFKGGSDTVSYRIELEDAAGPFTVTARLHYQSVAPSFINDLKSVKAKEVKSFLKLAKKTANTPVTVAEATRTVS